MTELLLTLLCGLIVLLVVATLASLGVVVCQVRRWLRGELDPYETDEDRDAWEVMAAMAAVQLGGKRELGKQVLAERGVPHDGVEALDLVDAISDRALATLDPHQAAARGIAPLRLVR